MLSPARKRLVLIIACSSTYLVNLDNTIVNVALPDIRAQLHASVPGLQWIVDSYLLTLTSLLILGGSLADRFGRRLVLQCGLVSFAVGSALCSLAPTAGWLIVFRIAQAGGASMLNPVGMSIVGTVFADPRDRARVFGIWGVAAGLGMASGPVLGGLLVQLWGWHAVFWAGVAPAAAGAVCAGLVIPESRSPTYRKPDLVGQALVLSGLAGAVFVIIEMPHPGISSLAITAGWATSMASFVALWRVERSRADPLLDLRFFRSVPFSVSMVIAVLNYAAIAGFLFLNTRYLQDVRGYSPLRAGVFTVPTALGISAGAALSGLLVRARGAQVALVAGGAAITGGAALIVWAAECAGPLPLVPGYTLLGLGFGAANTPVNNTAMAGMPRGQAGVAGAIASTSRQLGQTLGVAAFGALAVAGSWRVSAGVGLAVIVCGVVASRPAAVRSAERVCEQFQDV